MNFTKRKSGEIESEDQDIFKKIPCRKKQIDQILNLFGKDGNYPWPCIFIYGLTSTGKSLVVRTLLQDLNLPHAVVNCIESYSPRVLYENILDQVSGWFPSRKNNYEHFARCDNINDFVRNLPGAIESRNLSNQTIYIVLDKAERLRDLDDNILPVFLKLKELSNQNVCVILISEIVWEKFRSGNGFCEPVVVHFPNYTKVEMIEILCSKNPSMDHPQEFYRNYITLMLSVFHQVCRNLAELQYLAALNFPKYIEPLDSDEFRSVSARKLWRNIEPYFKRSLKTVYLREVSSNQWNGPQDEQELQKNIPGLTFKGTLELPFYSKYLLIAAYLASYNPSKSDRRFFVKNHRTSKKLKVFNRSSKVNNQILGPKIFSLDRMLAIFYSIVDEKVAPSAMIYSQVSSLVSLHLLAQVDKSDLLQTPKYKCLVSLDFIRNISRTVNFDIIRYLYDFI